MYTFHITNELKHLSIHWPLVSFLLKAIFISFAHFSYSLLSFYKRFFTFYVYSLCISLGLFSPTLYLSFNYIFGVVFGDRHFKFLNSQTVIFSYLYPRQLTYKATFSFNMKPIPCKPFWVVPLKCLK